MLLLVASHPLALSLYARACASADTRTRARACAGERRQHRRVAGAGDYFHLIVIKHRAAINQSPGLALLDSGVVPAVVHSPSPTVHPSALPPFRPAPARSHLPFISFFFNSDIPFRVINHGLFRSFFLEPRSLPLPPP
jgi:hypothetical protein